MSSDRISAAGRARLRARVAACLLADAGDTMIEVMIAALLVALIAAATFTGYSSVAHVASGENNRAQAASLAEADQARLHGLTLNNLSSSGTGASYGNTSYTQTVDNTVYTITSSTEFVSGNGAASCTTSGTTTADEVQTTSTVSWPSDGYAGGPVEIHGLVTPPQGGSLIVRVLNSGGSGISGVTVSLSGPTTVTPLTTDANGCVEFGGLSGGSYTVTGTQGSTTTTGSAVVVATQTKTVVLTPNGGNGGISATFTTTYNGSSHPSSADQVTAWDPANPTVYNVFGTASSLGNNTYASTVTSGNQYTPGNYTVYGGTCAGDFSNSGYQVAAVTNGTTQSVSLPLPAMIVDVYGSGGPTQTDDAPSSSVVYTGSNWTHSTVQTGNYDNTESWSQTAGNYVTYTFTGNYIEWIGPHNSNQGMANVLIDGTTVATDVNTYGSTLANQQVLFVDSGLSSGTHTIEIYVDGTAGPGASADYVPVDEFISGTGTSAQVDDAPSSSVVYTGGSDWTHGATGSQNYDSTESFDLTGGDYVTFTFTGTSVEWLAPVSTNGGYANIYLDGTLVASNITTYAASTVYQQVIWSTAGLANTTHTLKILIDGTKPSASTNTYAQIDSFVYGTQTNGLLSTAPLVTLTDENSGCSNENYPATQVPTTTQGALVDPGQPYGTWLVCASSGGVKNTATVSNTSYTAGNVVNVYLGTGSSGLTTGSCT
jgi:Tfp pilus assembly protein PilE